MHKDTVCSVSLWLKSLPYPLRAMSSAAQVNIPSAPLTPLLPDSGGRVGFHGRGSAIPWHDICIGAYFDAILRAMSSAA